MGRGKPRTHYVEPGQRFGQLTVLQEIPLEYPDGVTARGVLVRCACPAGTEKAVDLVKLATGQIQSCGCSKGDATPQARQLRRQLKAVAKAAGYEVTAVTLRKLEP